MSQMTTIFSTCRHSWLITGFVNRVTPWMPLVEQKRITLAEHMSSPPVFSWVRATRFLVLYVVFCRSLFVLFLLAIVLSVLIRFRDSDYPFGICNLFFQHPIFHIHIVKLVLPMNRQSLIEGQLVVKGF